MDCRPFFCATGCVGEVTTYISSSAKFSFCRGAASLKCPSINPTSSWWLMTSSAMSAVLPIVTCGSIAG